MSSGFSVITGKSRELNTEIRSIVCLSVLRIKEGTIGKYPFFFNPSLLYSPIFRFEEGSKETISKQKQA